MANLARKEAGLKRTVEYMQMQPAENRVIAYQKGNVLYGDFLTEGVWETDRLYENRRNLMRESVKAGIFFGLKIAVSSLAGLVLAYLILDFMNAPVRRIPGFVPAFLWISCAGASFCTVGGVRNVCEGILRRKSHQLYR